MKFRSIAFLVLATLLTACSQGESPSPVSPAVVRSSVKGESSDGAPAAPSASGVTSYPLAAHAEYSDAGRDGLTALELLKEDFDDVATEGYGAYEYVLAIEGQWRSVYQTYWHLYVDGVDLNDFAATHQVRLAPGETDVWPSTFVPKDGQILTWRLEDER